MPQRINLVMGRSVTVVEDELRTQPPWTEVSTEFLPSVAMRDRRDRLRQTVPRALRNTRHAVTSYGSPLRSCYDYMQKSAEGDEYFLPNIYKMIETMEYHLGGERVLCTRLSVKKEVKFLKRLADEGDRDERHAPKDQAVLRAPTRDERTVAREHANTLLRKFEQECRIQGAAG